MLTARGSAPSRSWLQVAALSAGLALAITHAVAGAAEPGPGRLVGKPLADALQALQAEGLPLVFTSEMVRPGMQVLREPTATTLMGVLREILEPHGLTTTESPGGSLVVVADLESRSDVPLFGRILSEETGEGLAGASIRVLPSGTETESDAQGRFELQGLEPGIYAVDVWREGFLRQELPKVVVSKEEGTSLHVVLSRIPFVNEEIVVRPSRLSLLREQPSAPMSLSRRQIEALPHFGGEVARALSLLPGTAANDVTAQLSIHGGRRDEVQILLDGQELYDAHHLKDFDSALSIVPSEGLGNVSLSTGAFSAQHGDRMSGVLDMTTVSVDAPHRLHLGLSIVSALATSAGTFDHGRGAWLGSLRRGTSDIAGRIADREDPLFWDGLGRLEYRITDRHRLRGYVLRSGDELEFLEQLENESSSIETEYRNAYSWLTHQAVVGNSILVETVVSASQSDRDRAGIEREGEGVESEGFAVADRRHLEVAGLRQSWDVTLPHRQQLAVGLELRRYDVVYDYRANNDRNFLFSGLDLEERAALPPYQDRLQSDHTAAWMSHRFSPVTDLVFELGLRYDRQTLSDDELLSPRLNGAWQLDQRSVLRAGWGLFYQTQRPYELLVADGDTTVYSAERSEHWVLGYERFLTLRRSAPLQAIRIEAYRRDVKDPRPRYENLFERLSPFPEMEEDRIRIEPERASAQGVEVVLRGSAGSRVAWWASYAWADATDRLEGVETPRFIDQPHTVNLDLNYRLGEHWNLNFAWRFHTGWPTTPVGLAEEEDGDGELELVAELGPLNSERLSTYHRMDVRLSRRWRVGGGELELYLDVHNLYDRKNVAGPSFDIDEEEQKLLVEEDTWIGFFPSFGISWEL